jgi:hypothetical protein
MNSNSLYGACTRCGTLFTYSPLSLIIQCPLCQNVQSKELPQPATFSTAVTSPPTLNPFLNLHNCPVCHFSFSGAPNAPLIQCPLCRTTFDSLGSLSNQPLRSLITTSMPLSFPQDSSIPIPLPTQQHNPYLGYVSHEPSPTPSNLASFPHFPTPTPILSSLLPISSNNDRLHSSNSATTMNSKLPISDPTDSEPVAPKRASNAYMLFCKENRRRLRSEQPDLPFGRIGQKLGEIWRSLTPEEKRPYEEIAMDDRERYKGEMKAYQNATLFSTLNRKRGLMPLALSNPNISVLNTPAFPTIAQNTDINISPSSFQLPFQQQPNLISFLPSSSSTIPFSSQQYPDHLGLTISSSQSNSTPTSIPSSIFTQNLHVPTNYTTNVTLSLSTQSLIGSTEELALPSGPPSTTSTTSTLTLAPSASTEASSSSSSQKIL